MAIKFSDVADLFEYVNSGSPSDYQGYICKVTGKTYFYSEFGDNEEELPEDIDDEEKYLAIPYKNDLDLGRELVFEFIQEYLPSAYENVRSMFRSKGAYTKFKVLIENAGSTEKWYQFESKRIEQALREWALAQDIEISD